MKKENLAFLFGGFAFGILIGYGLFTAVTGQPALKGSGGAAPTASGPAGPAGPRAPGQGGAPQGGSAAAPMVAEINALKQHLQDNPEDFDAVLRLAQLYDQVSMWQQAVPFYQRGLELQPDNLGVIVRLANIHHDNALWEQAVGYYQRALELKPDDPDLLTDAGVCYKGLTQYEQALELFGKANEIDPDHWQSLFNTVVVAGFDLGRYDLADAAIARLEAMQPQPPRLGELKQALDQHRSSEASRATGG